jgi:hypothetical protein
MTETGQKSGLAALRHHPLIGYFALVYGISWGGILIVLNSIVA